MATKVALLTAKPNTGGVDPSGHKMWVGEKRYPIGISYLYAVLKQHGIQADIFDFYSGMASWPQNDFEDYSFCGLYTTSVCKDHIMWILDHCKANVLAVGGPYASLNPEDFKSKTDIVCQGEAERDIVNFVQPNFVGGVCKTARLTSEELDMLPRFPWELYVDKSYDWTSFFDNKRKYLTFNTSRGCSYACTFCDVKRIMGRKYSYMSAERIFDDIRYCNTTFGTNAILFREDFFALHHGRIEELCKKIIDSKIDLKFVCELRADVPLTILRTLKQAGLDGAYIGAEAGSQRMLDIFNKQLKVEQIYKFGEQCKMLGIKMALSFIRKHPEETQHDINLRKKMIKTINPERVWVNTFRENI